MFIDGELSIRQRRDIHGHLDRCKECSLFEKDFRKLLGLKGKIKRESVPDNLFERVKERLKARKIKI